MPPEPSTPTSSSGETPQTTPTSILGSAPTTNEGEIAAALTPPAAAPVEPAPAPFEALTVEALALPEGLTFEGEQAEKFLGLANELQLPKERVESLLGLHSEMLQSAFKQAETQYTEAWEKTQNDWVEAVKAHPEIGGPNLEKSVAEIGKMLDRYGSKEAREAFDLTGAGNHPAIVQFLHKLAKQVNEAPPVSGAPPGTAATADRATRIFGNQKG